MALEQDYVYCLAASPTYEQDGLFFAAKQSGLYCSHDAGQTWQDAFASLNLNAPLPTTYVTLGFLQEDIPMVFASVEGHILRSRDGGETWEYAGLGSPAPVVTSLIHSSDSAQDGLLLAGTMQDGVFRSTNRGATWNSWNFGLFDANINTLAVSPEAFDNQFILAGTQSGIFRSLNGGRSWRDLDFPIDLAPVLTLGIHSNGIIFAGAENDGLFVSMDDGKNWQQSLADPVEQIICLQDGKLLVLTGSIIQISNDGGKSWQVKNEVDAGVSCIAAPRGLEPAGPIWLGWVDGKVTKV